MNNNDVLIRLRYALNITDLKVLELFKLGGIELSRPELASVFTKEGEPGYAECDDELARAFLSGLITSRRGPKDEVLGESPSAKAFSRAPAPRPGLLGNNEILRQIKIALALKDEDIIAIMKLAEVEVSKGEISALFRKRGHENYRPCGDQFLRNFLVGLTAKFRV